MAFLGMLKDSLRESLDRRSLIVLLIISTLFILICASIGYDQVSLDQALHEMERKFAHVAGGRWSHRSIEVRFEVLDIQTIGKEPDLEEFEGGTSFRVRAHPLAEFQKHVLYSRSLRGGKSQDSTIPGVSSDFKTVEKPPPDEDMTWFIGAKLKENNFSRPRVSLEGGGGDHATFRVWLKKTSTAFLSGGFRLNLLFGAWKWDVHDASVGDIVFFIQHILSSFIAGWMGILVAIVATAGFIPTMVQKGTVDLLLARPLPRWQVYLYKYFGGLIYVAITAGYLIVGSWFVIALRSGIWSAGFLYAWPLLVFFFAALYSVSSLIGLLSRSAIAAILISAVTWLFLFAVGKVYFVIHSPMAEVDTDHPLVRVVDLAHDVLPRLKDVDEAIFQLQLKANGITPERMAGLFREDQFPDVGWASLFGVTGFWMAAMLALGCWRFSKRDY